MWYCGCSESLPMLPEIHLNTMTFIPPIIEQHNIAFTYARGSGAVPEGTWAAHQDRTNT